MNLLRTKTGRRIQRRRPLSMQPRGSLVRREYADDFRPKMPHTPIDAERFVNLDRHEGNADTGANVLTGIGAVFKRRTSLSQARDNDSLNPFRRNRRGQQRPVRVDDVDCESPSSYRQIFESNSCKPREDTAANGSCRA